MIVELLIQLVFLVLLLLFSAFFSSSEVAFFYLDPTDRRRLSERHPAGARRIERILSSPTQFLSTVLIGNTIVNVAVSALAYVIFDELYPRHGEWLAVAASLFLLLIFGEIGPKRMAMGHPQRVALLYAPWLQFFMLVFKPLRLMLDGLTQRFSHRFRPAGGVLSEDEYETVVELSREQGVLDEEESEMLKGIIRLEELRASEVMTPRVDIIGIDRDDPEDDPVAIARRARVRQILVYRKQPDNAEGLLDVRQFLLDPEHRIEAAMRPPLYVPEACPLDRLLAQFLQERRRTALVVGEYGGTAGLVTRGDIIEEIVGDIDDEQGGHELLFTQIGPRRWLADGRVSLETLREALGISLDEEGVDRIAGWVTAQLERIPRPGDMAQTADWRVIVRQMRRNRVTLVELIRKEGEAK